MGLLCDLFRINYNILNLVLVNFRLYHHYEQTSREVTFTSQPRFHYKVVEASLSGEKKSITLKRGRGGHTTTRFWGFEQWYVPEGYIPVHASYVS